MLIKKHLPNLFTGTLSTHFLRVLKAKSVLCERPPNFLLHLSSYRLILPFVMQVRHQPPDAMFNLRASVEDRFSQLMDGASDADLQRHSKVIAFKESIRKYAMQGGTLTFLFHFLIIHLY